MGFLTGHWTATLVLSLKEDSMPIRVDEKIRGDKLVAEPMAMESGARGEEVGWERLDRWDGMRGGHAGEIDHATLVEAARTIVKARQQRVHDLPPAIFGEPAWDMLLALFIRPCSDEGERVSNLSLSSGTPATTALRWIDYLEREQFVTRRSSPTDKRVVFIRLTDNASEAIVAYLVSLFEHGILVAP